MKRAITLKIPVLLTVFTLILLGCKTKEHHQPNSDLAKSIDTSKIQTINISVKSDHRDITDNSGQFLKLFKDLDPINLHVYFERDKKTVISCQGVPIDLNKFSYLNDSTIFFSIKPAQKGLCHIFAVGKFKISEKYSGLILRQWSQYEESLVELVLWDNQEQKILKGIELADSFGDAGWIFDKESWITYFQFNKKIEILTRQKDFEAIFQDNSIKIIDSTKTDQIWLTTFEESRFVTKKVKEVDPGRFTLKNWTH
jgi:hypothetical protein